MPTNDSGWTGPAPLYAGSSVQRLERLINLLAALLEADRPLTAEQIRRLVPGYGGDLAAFRRMFERDKEALRDLGVELTVETAGAGGAGVAAYRVAKEDYYLPDPGLADDELAALRLASAAVRFEGESGPDPSGGLLKLGGRAPGDGDALWPAALPGAPHLVALFRAISERRRVSFTYHQRARELEPHRLSFRSGRWYLLAVPTEGQEARWFRLDRIGADLALVGEPGAFERQDAIARARALPPWEQGGDEAVEAHLLVDADQAGWAVRHLGTDAVERWEPDGSVVVRARVTNRDAWRSFVLGFLDHAEVLDPPELRREMVSWLEGLAG